MAQDVVITPASGKMEFFQDVGGSAVANIQLDSSTSDLSLSTTAGNLIIGDASRDVYIGDGINSVDIVFEQNGEIRGLTNKTLTLGQSDSIVNFNTSKTTFSAGNVGIGTTSPDAKLHSVSTTEQLRLGYDATNYWKFTVDSGGNLKLESTGLTKSINFSNNDLAGVNSITINDAGVGEGIFIPNTSGNWSIDSSPLNRSNAAGNLNLYGTVNNIALWRPALFVYNASNYATITPQSNGGINFTTTGGDITFNQVGNVGIGTTGPNAKLSFGTTVVDNKIYLYDATNDKYGFGIRSSQFMIYAGAGGTSTGGITFGTFNGTTFTENVRFQNGGNVGIGTTSPSAKLHIYDNSTNYLTMLGPNAAIVRGLNVKISNWDANTGVPLNLFETEHTTVTRNNEVFRIHSNETGTSSKPFRITAQGTLGSPTYEALTVNYLGNVGIGTTTPSFKLDINGNAKISSNLGIGGAPATDRVLTIVGDGTNPSIRLDNQNIDASVSSNGKDFLGWLPIDISGSTRYMQLYKNPP
jgi:hypothetical protein